MSQVCLHVSVSSPRNGVLGLLSSIFLSTRAPDRVLIITENPDVVDNFVIASQQLLLKKVSEIEVDIILNKRNSKKPTLNIIQDYLTFYNITYGIEVSERTVLHRTTIEQMMHFLDPDYVLGDNWYNRVTAKVVTPGAPEGEKVCLGYHAEHFERRYVLTPHCRIDSAFVDFDRIIDVKNPASIEGS